MRGGRTGAVSGDVAAAYDEIALQLQSGGTAAVRGCRRSYMTPSAHRLSVERLPPLLHDAERASVFCRSGGSREPTQRHAMALRFSSKEMPVAPQPVAAASCCARLASVGP
jgi:hypothetical protein